jgi:hypothetical protein
MEITIIKEVPQEVKNSRFGCINCLWASIECKQGSKYKEEFEKGKKFCATYTYYD